MQILITRIMSINGKVALAIMLDNHARSCAAIPFAMGARISPRHNLRRCPAHHRVVVSVRMRSWTQKLLMRLKQHALRGDSSTAQCESPTPIYPRVNVHLFNMIAIFIEHALVESARMFKECTSPYAAYAQGVTPRVDLQTLQMPSPLL